MKIPGKKRVSIGLICIYSALVASSATFLAAQSATQRQTAGVPPPLVNSILDRYEAAIGGVRAWKKSNTRVIKGTVELSPPSLKGIVELYQAAPDKMLFQMKVPGLGVASVIVNGSDGWQKDFAAEPRRLHGDELSDARLDADFCKEVDLRKLYSHMEYGGASLIDSQPVDIVRAVTATGRSHTLYFDRSTGLLVREDFVSVGPQGRETVQTFFEDYRELKDVGIKYPFLVRQVTQRAVQTLRFEDVLHNVPVENSMFDPPSR